MPLCKPTHKKQLAKQTTPRQTKRQTKRQTDKHTYRQRDKTRVPQENTEIQSQTDKQRDPTTIEHRKQSNNGTITTRETPTVMAIKLKGEGKEGTIQ